MSGSGSGEERTCREDMGSDPCGQPAVGERLDPEYGNAYPVCSEHLRPPFPGGDIARWEEMASALRAEREARERAEEALRESNRALAAAQDLKLQHDEARIGGLEEALRATREAIRRALDLRSSWPEDAPIEHRRRLVDNFQAREILSAALSASLSALPVQKEER